MTKYMLRNGHPMKVETKGRYSLNKTQKGDIEITKAEYDKTVADRKKQVEESRESLRVHLLQSIEKRATFKTQLLEVLTEKLSLTGTESDLLKILL